MLFVLLQKTPQKRYIRLLRLLRPLLYIWRFEPYRNSLLQFAQTVTGVGSVIALVFIVIFVGATLVRAAFEGAMAVTKDTEFQLLVLNADTGFQAFLTMFTLMTTGENIIDLVCARGLWLCGVRVSACLCVRVPACVVRGARVQQRQQQQQQQQQQQPPQRQQPAHNDSSNLPTTDSAAPCCCFY